MQSSSVDVNNGQFATLELKLVWKSGIGGPIKNDTVLADLWKTKIASVFINKQRERDQKMSNRSTPYITAAPRGCLVWALPVAIWRYLQWGDWQEVISTSSDQIKSIYESFSESIIDFSRSSQFWMVCSCIYYYSYTRCFSLPLCHAPTRFSPATFQTGCSYSSPVTSPYLFSQD